MSALGFPTDEPFWLHPQVAEIGFGANLWPEHGVWCYRSSATNITTINDGAEGPIEMAGNFYWFLGGQPQNDFDAWLAKHPGTDEEKMLAKLTWGHLS